MRRTMIGTLLVLSFTACSTSAADVTDVTLEEFSIGVGDPHWRAGPLTLDVDNAGRFAHTLVVTSSEGTVVEMSPVLEPGEHTTMQLDLAPGTYHLTCRIVAETPDGEVVDHYEHGMHTTVTVEDV